MKTKVLCFLAILFFVTPNLYSQQRFVIENSTMLPRIFNHLDSALADLQSGDRLYIPGGIYPNPLEIDVSGVVVYGAGHDPDSTMTTRRTQFPSLNVMAPLVFVRGIYFNDIISISAPSCSISYCYGSHMNISEVATSCFIHGCVIDGSIQGSGVSSVTFIGNILNGRVSGFGPGDVEFEDNYFSFVGIGNTVASTPRTLQNIESAIFRKNIFRVGADSSPSFLWRLYNNSTNLIFEECSFKTTSFPAPFYEDGNAMYYDCFGEVDFVQGIYPGQIFNYDFNYHLTGSNPLIGPYNGGFKEGSVPNNPHISTSMISDTLTTDGKLNVKMLIIAQ